MPKSRLVRASAQKHAAKEKIRDAQASVKARHAELERLRQHSRNGSARALQQAHAHNNAAAQQLAGVVKPGKCKQTRNRGIKRPCSSSIETRAQKAKLKHQQPQQQQAQAHAGDGAAQQPAAAAAAAPAPDVMEVDGGHAQQQQQQQPQPQAHATALQLLVAAAAALAPDAMEVDGGQAQQQQQEETNYPNHTAQQLSPAAAPAPAPNAMEVGGTSAQQEPVHVKGGTDRNAHAHATVSARSILTLPTRAARAKGFQYMTNIPGMQQVMEDAGYLPAHTQKLVNWIFDTLVHNLSTVAPTRGGQYCSSFQAFTTVLSMAVGGMDVSQRGTVPQLANLLHVSRHMVAEACKVGTAAITAAGASGANIK